MAAIIGKKLGMTQVFTEDGTRVPVTVIEAGPCPVTAVRDPERDGYARRPARASARRPSAGSPRPSSATSRRPARAPSRTLVEFRDDGRRAPSRRRGHGRGLRAGPARQGVRDARIGKGFQGTIKRHNFSRGPVSHGSHNVRAPGLDRRQRRPRPRLQGREDAGADGRRAASPSAACEVVEVDAERNLLLVRGAVPGPAQRHARGQERRPWRWPRQGSRAGHAAQGRPSGGRLRRGLPRVARPRRRSRRPRSRASRHRLDADPRRGLDDDRQGVAPEGPRPRPRRRAERAPPARRRSGVRPQAAAATRSRSTARRAAARCAPRSRFTPRAASIAVIDASRFDEPSTKQAAAGAREVGRRDARRWSSLAADEAAAREELSQHRPRRRARRPTRSASPTWSAPPRSSSPRPRSSRSARRAEAPRVRRQAERRRRTADGRAPGDHRAGRLREELRADGRRQVHVPRPRPARTRPRSRARSRRSSASGWPPCGPPQVRVEAEAPRRPPRQNAVVEEGDRRSSRRATGSSSSRARRSRSRGTDGRTGRQSHDARPALRAPTRCARR